MADHETDAERIDRLRREHAPGGVLRLLDLSVNPADGQMYCINQWPTHYTRDDFLKVAGFVLLHLARNSPGSGDAIDFHSELGPLMPELAVLIPPPEGVS